MAAAAMGDLAALDAETLALLGRGPDMAPVVVCGEWETFKENVRPLKRGRNVGLLNQALKAHADPAQRAALLAERRYGSPSALTQQGLPCFVGFGSFWSGFLGLGSLIFLLVRCLMN